MSLFRSTAGRMLVVTVVLGVVLAVALVLVLLVDGIFNTVTYDVVVTPAVFDSDTKAPVPGCLITVDDGMANGLQGAAARTEADGRAGELKTHEYALDGDSYLREGRWFAAVDRRRRPTLLLYVGDAPHHRSQNGTSYLDTEAWNVRLRFWSPGEGDVVPAVDVERSLKHVETDADFKSRIVSRAFPDRLGTPPEARVHVWPLERRPGPHFDYHGVYRVELRLYLDKAQTATCQAPTLAERSARIDALLAAQGYANALEELQHLIPEQQQEYAADYGRIAVCQAGLGREREALATARKAAALTVWGHHALPTAPQGESGEALLEHGRYQEAARYFEKLAADNKEDPRGFVGLGSALYGLGRCAHAAAAFDTAARVGSLWRLPDASGLLIRETCGRRAGRSG